MTENKVCNCEDGYDESYHCKDCDECLFDWIIISEPNDEYLEAGRCVECAMKQGMTLETLVDITQ